MEKKKDEKNYQKFFCFGYVDPIPPIQNIHSWATLQASGIECVSMHYLDHTQKPLQQLDSILHVPFQILKQKIFKHKKKTVTQT